MQRNAFGPPAQTGIIKKKEFNPPTTTTKKNLKNNMLRTTSNIFLTWVHREDKLGYWSRSGTLRTHRTPIRSRRSDRMRYRCRISIKTGYPMGRRLGESTAKYRPAIPHFWDFLSELHPGDKRYSIRKVERLAKSPIGVSNMAFLAHI